MDAKAPLLAPSVRAPEDVNASDDATMRQKRKSKFQVAALVILLSIFWLARTWSCDHEHSEADTKVPLDVHIMRVRPRWLGDCGS
tara:strand:- start:20289 stop:20543 length:255 start_codon:yes stop_codon:yes gene_type:complete